ncbi:nucleotidyltransferase [Fusobacterium sp.]|uniref:nucleotidyltransferase n=1 Tax=Fusobacterium sp. TaxID=68766 RepID=UPI00396C3587
MKATGIIVEYNPFHNGHKYHLTNARKLGDIVIAVMSGDFVQRGEPSIIDRWTKTEMALDNGVDLVVELPAFYSSQSAEIFAKGGIGILEELKCDTILFGSESADIEELKRISEFQESTEFQFKLKERLNRGLSYPTAHSETMNEILKDTRLDSNDILGLEYLKAIKYWKSSITPEVLKREKTGYHDSTIVDNFASATKIRKSIKDNLNIENVIPLETSLILKKYRNFTYMENFYPYIRYELLKNYKTLGNIQDMETGFENRLFENSMKYENYQDFFNKIINKRYTLGRIQRVLIHSLTGLTKEITQNVKKEIPYVKILGFSQKGQEYLTWLKKFENKKIITTYKKMNQIFNEDSCKLIEFNERCSEIYRLVNPYKNRKSPIIYKEETNEQQ